MNQKKILIFSICCVVTLFLLNSYAILTAYDISGNVVTFQTGYLQMSINNTSGLLNLNGKLPESDEIGLTNSTPIVLTLTNTGTMDIEKYEVKLINEVEKDGLNIVNSDYIKCAVSLDGGVNYSILGTLGSLNNNVYTGYSLDVSKSKTIYLKIWIDENAGNEVLGKTFYGSISVELYQSTDFNLSQNVLNNVEIKKVNDKSCSDITIEEDGTTYLSGSNNCIDFNYVWYSGKLWRATAVNQDGTVKLISDKNLTVLSYGTDKTFYTNETTKSYIYQWLNEDFLDTLYNYENIIVTNQVWNASPGNGTISSKLPIAGQSEVLVNASVGLLNSYEYYKSYQKLGSYANGYLNFKYYHFLLNPYNSSSANVWVVNNTGNPANMAPSSMLAFNPSIVIKPNIKIDEGTGTRLDPFKLEIDKEDIVPNTTLLNTRSSGEYVKFGGELFRIVGVENNTTKLNKADYLKDNNGADMNKQLASSINFGKDTNTKTSEYWDYYLNSTWLKQIDSTYNETTSTSDILTKGTYYVKTYTSGNYKSAVCNSASNSITIKDCEKTTNTWTGYVGLPRYAEMFSDVSAIFSWMLTPYNTTRVWCIGSDGRNYNGTPASEAGSRPSIHVKSEIVIKSGNGTKEAPFVIGVKS